MKFCGISASALGLDAAGLCRLKEALDNPDGPLVIWLQGSECTGCSLSFLSRISLNAPLAAKDVLIQSTNLFDPPNLMAPGGNSAAARIEAAYSKGGYVLAVEGGVPADCGGIARGVWSRDHQEGTLQKAILDLSAKATAILAVGTCAAFGGIPAAPPHPNRLISIKNLTGRTAINIAGCPPHPDRIAWVVVQILLHKPIFLDSSGRPKAFLRRTVHRQCAREENETGEAGLFGADGRRREANTSDLGCVHSKLPGPQPFYKSED